MLGLVAWTGALAVGLAALHATGGVLAPPPLSDPGRVGAWLELRQPAEAAVALVRLLAIGSAWYLLAATVAATVARVVGSASLVRVVDAVTVPLVRRLAHGAVGASIAAASLAGVGGPALAEPPAVGIPSAATMSRLPDAEADAPAPAPPGRPPTETMRILPDAAAGQTDASQTGAGQTGAGAVPAMRVLPPGEAPPLTPPPASPPPLTPPPLTPPPSPSLPSRAPSTPAAPAGDAEAGTADPGRDSHPDAPGAAADARPGRVARPVRQPTVPPPILTPVTSEGASDVPRPSGPRAAPVVAGAADAGASGQLGRSAATDAADPEASPPARSRTWVVEPGHHFWAMAEQILADAWERPPTDDDVDTYWRTLVGANRALLRDPSNPDLLFPGQVLDLPDPPPGRG